MDIQEFEKRIEKIEERNHRVEVNKAWEGSKTRKVCIIVLTYFLVVLFMHTVHIGNPWVGAIIPSIGFFLSTLTLPFLKNKWIEKQK